jgi:hypothetical protein
MLEMFQACFTFVDLNITLSEVSSVSKIVDCGDLFWAAKPCGVHVFTDVSEKFIFRV